MITRQLASIISPNRPSLFRIAHRSTPSSAFARPTHKFNRSRSTVRSDFQTETSSSSSHLVHSNHMGLSCSSTHPSYPMEYKNANPHSLLHKRMLSANVLDVLAANHEFSIQFDETMLAKMPATPARKVAFVTCMDSRLDPCQFAGLKAGDAHIIRNGGGRVTDDVIRSLVVSHKLMGTQEIFVIQHTRCGFEMFTNEIITDLLAHSLEPAVLLANNQQQQQTQQQQPENNENSNANVNVPAATRGDKTLHLCSPNCSSTHHHHTAEQNAKVVGVWKDVGMAGTGNRAAAEAIDFMTIKGNFKNQDEAVLHDVHKIRSHPLIPSKVVVHGYVYDVTTGRLRDVEAVDEGSNSS